MNYTCEFFYDLSLALVTFLQLHQGYIIEIIVISVISKNAAFVFTKITERNNSGKIQTHGYP